MLEMPSLSRLEKAVLQLQGKPMTKKEDRHLFKKDCTCTVCMYVCLSVCMYVRTYVPT